MCGSVHALHPCISVPDARAPHVRISREKHTPRDKRAFVGKAMLSRGVDAIYGTAYLSMKMASAPGSTPEGIPPLARGDALPVIRSFKSVSVRGVLGGYVSVCVERCADVRPKCAQVCVSGQTREDVLEFFEAGARFVGERGLGVGGEEGRRVRLKAGEMLEQAHKALGYTWGVNQEGASHVWNSKIDTHARAGTIPIRQGVGVDTLGGVGRGGEGYLPLIPTAVLDRECELVSGLLRSFRGIQFPRDLKLRVDNETNANTKKDTSMRERVALEM